MYRPKYSSAPVLRFLLLLTTEHQVEADEGVNETDRTSEAQALQGILFLRKKEVDRFFQSLDASVRPDRTKIRKTAPKTWCCWLVAARDQGTDQRSPCAWNISTTCSSCSSDQ